ncbi:MAG: cation:proton antiporter [Thermoplasmata archaeon]|nr:MAG: cation:proton antiporter [Thermoplasmata archaeon]
MIPPLQYFIALFLIVAGIWTIMLKKNLIKILIGLSVADTGVNLLLITLAYRNAIGGAIPTAPIYTGYEKGMIMVSPLPQALVLTAIVIGVSVLALALAITLQIYRHYGTLNVEEIRRLRG